jgi:hypothetical protein
MKIRSLLVLSALLLFIKAHAFAFYDPGAGRWLSKDPIGERGGLNLYSFIVNSAVNHVDVLGLVGKGPCLEVPITSVFSAPNTGWTQTKMDPVELELGSYVVTVSAIEVKWEARVTVDCNCGAGYCDRKASGTRIEKQRVELVDIILGQSLNPLPAEIPTPTSAAAFIGETLAARFTEILGHTKYKPLDVGEMQRQANLVKPSTPRQGKWKNGDPCAQFQRR